MVGLLIKMKSKMRILDGLVIHGATVAPLAIFTHSTICHLRSSLSGNERHDSVADVEKETNRVPRKWLDKQFAQTLGGVDVNQGTTTERHRCNIDY